MSKKGLSKPAFYPIPTSSGGFVKPTNEGYVAWVEKKKVIRKKAVRKVGFKVNGVIQVPMNDTVAASLDAADVIKYIGKKEGRHYDYLRRKNFKLVERPTYNPLKTTLAVKTSLSYYGTTINVPIRDLSLVSRGDASAKAYNRAARYIPARLKRIKRDLLNLVENSKEITDNYLEALPLHKKLELFKSFTLEEQQLYDFIHKDIQEVFHPKEEEEKPKDNGTT